MTIIDRPLAGQLKHPFSLPLSLSPLSWLFGPRPDIWKLFYAYLLNIGNISCLNY